MLAPGQIIDRYVLEGVLGRGGVAIVWAARHVDLGTPVAIKLLVSPVPDLRDRLVREGQAQAQLRHPNIVPVHDVISVHGAPGLVMERVEGTSLKELLARFSLDLARADALAVGILDGVAAAHAAGFVHRDLKPGNILLARAGASLVPRICDFGLAKVLHGERGPGATRSGAVLGTPAYLAPEQSRDAGKVDARADVFALGAVLFELVSGVRAFEGDDIVEVIARIQRGPQPPDLTRLSELPPRVSAAIGAALQLDPDDRPADAAALAALWTGGDRTVGRKPGAFGGEIGRWVAERAEETTLSFSEVTATEEGATSATFSALPIAVDAIAAPAVRRRRWLPWGAAAVMGIGIGIGAAWFALAPGRSGAVIGIAPPVVIADPVLQDRFAQGWRALIEADLAGAERRIAVVADADPADPRPDFALSLAQRLRGRSGAGLASFWRAVDRAEGREDEASRLLRIARDVRHGGWDADAGPLLAHLEAHPDDASIALLALDLLPTDRTDDAVAICDAALAASPGAAVLHLVKARRLLAAERWTEAEAAAKAGLAAVPGTPALLIIEGQIALHLGRWEVAARAFERTLAADGSLHRARALLAVAALHSGDRARADDLVAQAMGSTTPVPDQIAFARTLAEAYVGLGDRPAAVAILDAAEAAAEAAADPLQQLVVVGERANLYYLTDRPDLAEIDVDRALRLVAEPEYPDGERQSTVRNLLYAQGVVAADLGRVDQAAAILDRLRSLDGVPPVMVEWLAREVATAQRRPDLLPDLVAHIGSTCERQYVLGTSLRDAGAPDRAAPILDALLEAPTPCAAWGWGLYMQIRARSPRAGAHPIP